ncbi:MAG: hypothetical protein KIS79_13355 [Burkholderiales bacterium]|nr:hypothetical protein [Burkholderiales bacterium]
MANLLIFILIVLLPGTGAAQSAGLGLPARAPAQQEETMRIELGRALFMDPRLSRDGTVACGTCHVPEQGFAFNALPTSIGIEGQRVRRNAPTVLNVAYNESLFHDGRVATLEEQAWGPLLAADEMGNADRASVVARLAVLPEYVATFRRAFGAGVSAERIGTALAAYQRSLVSGGSRFDRWYYGNEVDALNAQEKHGFVVFRGKAQCNACHKLGRQHALFTDEAFHNLGIGVPDAAAGDGRTSEAGSGVAGAPSDAGRFEVTGKARDRFAFRTPTLRNVELTAPYMHDGSLATWREVVDFYDRGGNGNPDLDPLIGPLFLNEQDKEDLVAFMRTLTGANVEELARQARAAAPPLSTP